MRSKIDEKSAAQGYAESRLPQFTEEEEAMVLGSSDFLGLNIYTSFLVYPEQVTRRLPSSEIFIYIYIYTLQGDIEQVDFYTDQDVGSYQDETWYQSGASWLKVTPWGMRQAITWASRRSGGG